MNKKKKDVFTDALEESFLEMSSTNFPAKKDVILDKNINSIKLRSNTKEQKENWDDLKESISGRHAERFNNILEQLPDREFVRVYIKILEFVKPKINRQEGASDFVNDNRIIVEIKRNNTNENRTIDVSED